MLLLWSFWQHLTLLTFLYLLRYATASESLDAGMPLFQKLLSVVSQDGETSEPLIPHRRFRKRPFLAFLGRTASYVIETAVVSAADAALSSGGQHSDVSDNYTSFNSNHVSHEPTYAVSENPLKSYSERDASQAYEDEKQERRVIPALNDLSARGASIWRTIVNTLDDSPADASSSVNASLKTPPEDDFHSMNAETRLGPPPLTFKSQQTAVKQVRYIENALLAENGLHLLDGELAEETESPFTLDSGLNRNSTTIPWRMPEALVSINQVNEIQRHMALSDAESALLANKLKAQSDALEDMERENRKFVPVLPLYRRGIKPLPPSSQSERRRGQSSTRDREAPRRRLQSRGITIDSTDEVNSRGPEDSLEIDAPLPESDGLPGSHFALQFVETSSDVAAKKSQQDLTRQTPSVMTSEPKPAEILNNLPYSKSRPSAGPMADLPLTSRFWPFPVPAPARLVLLEELVSHVIENQLQRDIQVPIGGLLRAVSHGDPLPTLVPDQSGPLPKVMDDIFCNPRVVPGGCSSAYDWTGALGRPMKALITRNPVAKVLRRGGDMLSDVHTRLTRGITAPLVDTLEMEPAIRVIESLGINTYENLMHFDAERLKNDVPPDVIDNGAFESHLPTVYAFAACRLSNDRLPFCPIVKGDSDFLQDPYGHGTYRFIESEGFWGNASLNSNLPERLRVTGFDSACTDQDTGRHSDRICSFFNHESVHPSDFDGVYTLIGENQDFQNTGIYFKEIQPKLASRGHNLNSPQTVNALYLFFGIFDGANVDLVTTKGLIAAITPNGPQFDDVFFRDGAGVVVFREGTSFPSTCIGQSGNTFGESSSSTFPGLPVCLSDAEGWHLARFTADASGCRIRGLQYDSQTHLCHFPLGPILLEIS